MDRDICHSERARNCRDSSPGKAQNITIITITNIECIIYYHYLYIYQMLLSSSKNYAVYAVLIILVAYWLFAFGFARVGGGARESFTLNADGLVAALQQQEEVCSVAIVTMMREPIDVERWLNHHLAKGISRFYVRLETLEGERDTVASLLRTYPQVTLQLGEPLDATGGKGPGMNDTPGQAQMIRQQQWVSEAIRLALRDGVSWIIHIDSDELLSTELVSIGKAIAADASRQTQTMTVRNLEAVYPSGQLSKAAPCFRHVGLRDCSRDGTCASYANGKGVGRVSPFLRESGVHRFHYSGPDRDDEREMTQMTLVHYESCNFDKYMSKFLQLSGTERLSFPFKYYNDSIAVARSPDCQQRQLQQSSTTCRQRFEQVYRRYRMMTSEEKYAETSDVELGKSQ